MVGGIVRLEFEIILPSTRIQESMKSITEKQKADWIFVWKVRREGNEGKKVKAS